MRLALADFYLRDGKWQKAEPLYREIIVADAKGPRGVTARNRLAAAQLRAGKAAEAGKLLAEVLAVNPRDQDALQMRASVALARKDAGAAILDLRTLLRDQPNSMPLRRKLAGAYVMNGDVALAEDTIREGLQSSPSMLLAELAALYEQMGRTDQAIEQYEQLHAKNPKSEVAANNLAMMLVTYRSDAKSLEEAATLTQPFASFAGPRATRYVRMGSVQAGQGERGHSRVEKSGFDGAEIANFVVPFRAWRR